MNQEALRQLPSIDRLLQHAATADLITQYSHDLTVNALRAALDTVRANVLAGQESVPSDNDLITMAGRQLTEWLAPTLMPVINATGVIIHTNLGRAPLSDTAIKAINAVAGGYSTLEFDLETGIRGSRSTHAEGLLCRLTGAEAAFVVNNNAAATMLALSALAGPSRDNPNGQEVIVSRGQLVEIGGGYRMPDVMQQSGARMVEVGTTNRTHLHDYEQAITADSALMIRVHHSNYAVIGFTTEPEIAELVALAHRHELLLVDDIGSGALLDTAQFGLGAEPLVQHSLASGVDLIMFSGDKLLGGPQAGILIGKAPIIERLKRHPLARAVRPDKLCLAGLSATLTHYLKGEALEQVPVWRMIAIPLSTIRDRVLRWCTLLGQAGLRCELTEGQSMVGGGSLPGEELPTMLLAIELPSPERAAAFLRDSDPPVIVRREAGHILLDPRTVLERDEEPLLAALCQLTTIF